MLENGRIAGLDTVGRSATRRAAARPVESFLTGLAATGAGVGLLTYAVRSSAVKAGIAGVVLTAVGLWLVNERVRAWTARRPLAFLLASVVLLLAGAATMALAFAEDAAGVAGLALVLLVAGLLPAGALVRRATPTGGRWGAPAGLAVGLVSPLVGSRGAGLVLALAGLVLCRRSLRRRLADLAYARKVTWSGVAGTAAGALLLVGASRTSNSQAAFAGAVALAFGVMAMSEGWPRLGLRPIPPVALMVIGAGLFLAGLLVLPAAGLKLPAAAALALAGVLGLAGASFVMRGEGLLLVVVLGLGSVWVVMDRSDEVPVDPNPAAPGRIVALGDSYISGEGSPSYLPGTNDRGRERNECRRSRTAFPYRLAEELGMGLDFLACSGAKAVHLHAGAQYPRSPAGIAGGKPQLDHLPADVSRVKVVLVSIGGNDALFGDVGQGCVLPGSCAALREMFLANLDQIGPKVTRAYEEIRKRLPNVPIVAIPYPMMLTERTCSWSLLHDAEHEFLTEFVTVLNDRIRVSAANAGVHFFEGNLFAYEKRRICDGGADDTAMNFLSLGPVDGSFADRINPRNWIHNSLHPKPAGHGLTTEALKRYLEPLLAAPPANPAPDPTARFRLRNVGSARPVLARPSGLPGGFACPGAGQVVSPFASSVLLFDERSSFVLDAVPESPVCYTRPDGSWASENPADPGGQVILDDGVVRVAPAVPAEGDVQQVVYRDRELGWHLRTVAFCSRRAECPDSVGDFLNVQLADAARELALPVLLLFFAGWSFTIGVSRRSVDEDLAGPLGARAAAPPRGERTGGT